MEIDDLQTQQYQINIKPMALPIMKHSPLSAFISFSSILLPFLFWEDTFLAYILIISPIYISYKSYYLAIVLGLIAIFWPNLTQKNILMRFLILINAIYILISNKNQIKYKMTPTKVKNTGLPILI